MGTDAVGAKKRMHDAKLEVADCTFAPTTGRGPQQGARAEMAALPPSQRLYQRVDEKWTQVDGLSHDKQIHVKDAEPPLHQDSMDHAMHPPLP